MPERTWPPMQRRLARAVRAVAYTAAAGAGFAVLIVPGGLIADDLGVVWSYALGALALMASATALVGLASFRWRLEWVATSQAFVPFSVYTGLQWMMVYRHGEGELGVAFLLTFVSATLFARIVDLWIFSLSTEAAQTARGQE